MERIVLTFGLISGFVLATLTAILLTLVLTGTLDLEQSEVVGYSTMVLSFTLVFFGIRSYRENVAGGIITFGRAFKVGILIALITCAVYVIAWEIAYYNFLPDFTDRYAAIAIERMREKGASEAEIAQTVKQMARFKELYANPFINVGITFLEVFPVGLIVTLISAGILRRSSPQPAAA